MEVPSWAVLALAFLASLIFLSKVLLNPKPHRQFPPGPKPWPIIGNLNLFGSDPHQSLYQLSAKYGQLMQLKFGSTPVLVASSPEMAKELLKTHDQIFATRRATAATKYTSYNSSDMLWAPYGPYWRQARKIFVREVLHSKQLDSFEHIRVEERLALMSRIFSLSGKIFLLRDHLTRFTITNISRMVLGNKYFIESKSDESIISFVEFRELVDEWFFLNGVFNIGDWIPWLSSLDLQGYVKKMKALFRKQDWFYSHVLNDHKMKREAKEKDFVPEDMVDVLLQFADDPNLEVKLTDDCIKALTLDLILGGTDTSAITIEWAMSELMKQPDIIRKATEELDRVVGRDRWVEERDFPQLPYLDAIVKEAMRLHPVATLLPPHCAVEDCNVAGYDIRKGTIVLVNVWGIGRDPRYWEEPHKFCPERFLGKEINPRGQHFGLIPFGSGRRTCPGYNLGMKLIRSILANLLHGFVWKLPENMKAEDLGMEELFGLTTRRKIPLAVVVEPKLTPRLYWANDSSSYLIDNCCVASAPFKPI